MIAPVEELQTRIHGDASLPPLVYLPGLHGDWTLVTSFRLAMALFAVTQNGSHGVDVTPGFLMESYVTAALLAGLYLLGDWLLARKPKTGASPNGDPEMLVSNSGGPGGPPSRDR